LPFRCAGFPLRRAAHGHFPALAVMTAVLSFNLFGDAWRDWLDPRTRSQNGRQRFFELTLSPLEACNAVFWKVR